MRSLILVIGFLLVAGTAGATTGSDQAIAGSPTEAVPEVAASEPIQLPASAAVGAIELTAEGSAESDTATTDQRRTRECPTRRLKGRYNRCR